MKIDENCINHNALNLIKDITSFAYDTLGESQKDKLTRDAYLYSIQGIVEFAELLKEVLHT